MKKVSDDFQLEGQMSIFDLPFMHAPASNELQRCLDKSFYDIKCKKPLDGMKCAFHIEGNGTYPGHYRKEFKTDKMLWYVDGAPYKPVEGKVIAWKPVLQCEGCKYEHDGTYEVDKHGYTWHYQCPRTATANWPSGTPQNVSLTEIELDGFSYSGNEGHIFCYTTEEVLPSLKEITELIGKKYSLSFTYKDRTKTKYAEFDCYEAKYMGGSITLDEGHYATRDERDGKRFIGVDAMCKTSGMSRPCDFIEEVEKAVRIGKENIAKWKDEEQRDKERKAVCNGSSEPVEQCTDNAPQGEWINPDKRLPEKSGYYLVRDIKGQEYQTWFEHTTHGFNHDRNYAIEAWKAMPQEEKAVCPEGKWDSKCATCSQWHFNKYADCSCKHTDCGAPEYKHYEALAKETFPWNEFETKDGLNFPPEKKDWTIYEVVREYVQHNERRVERIRYKNTTFIGLEKGLYPMDNTNIIRWREVPEEERTWKE